MMMMIMSNKKALKSKNNYFQREKKTPEKEKFCKETRLRLIRFPFRFFLFRFHKKEKRNFFLIYSYSNSINEQA